MNADAQAHPTIGRHAFVAASAGFLHSERDIDRGMHARNFFSIRPSPKLLTRRPSLLGSNRCTTWSTKLRHR